MVAPANRHRSKAASELGELECCSISNHTGASCSGMLDVQYERA